MGQVCLSDVALGHRDGCARVCCSSYLGSNSVIVIILKIIEPVVLNENNVTFSECLIALEVISLT